MTRDYLFMVRNVDNEFIKIYGVCDDSSGYPKFLIRKEKQWIWKSAKHFLPLEEVSY